MAYGGGYIPDPFKGAIKRLSGGLEQSIGRG